MPTSPADLAARVRELPALPAAVLALMRMLADDDASAGALASRIAQDASLTAKTLRLANSSFYGMSRRIDSVADAVAVLGLRTVGRVAVAAGVASSFAAPAGAGFDFAAFWRHAIGTALCAAALARRLGHDAGAAFTAGLLHDIGQLALATQAPDDCARVSAHRRRHDEPALFAERAVLGTDHAALGLELALHWKFGPRIAGAIGGHHEPLPDEDGPAGAAGGAPASLADLVHVADNIAHALDLSGAADDLVPPLSMDAWRRLRLDEAQCLEVLRRTADEHDAVCAALLG